MLKQTHTSLDDIISTIPQNAKVLDVGGAFAPLRRADYIIDILPYAQVNEGQAKGPGPVRFSSETWVQHDICSRKPFPFPDKFFDFVHCSHTLEDIRDPVGVLDEITRVGKAGYIEIPSRWYETSYGIEGKTLAGACHHHWIIELVSGKLQFTFKNSWVHLPFVARKKPPVGEDRVLKLLWEDSFAYYENPLITQEQVFGFLLGTTDPKAIRKFYRKLFGENVLYAFAKDQYHRNPKLKSLVDRLGIKKRAV